jgi:DNA polymerase-1
VLDHVDELSPARAKTLREHADVARESKLLATMRRDLDIEFDPAELVTTPPDRSQLGEMFRRFEFRNLLRRVDELDAALPAAERPPIPGYEVPWVEGPPTAVTGTVAVVGDAGRIAIATPEGPVAVTADLDAVGPALRDAERVIVHGGRELPRSFWRAGIEPVDDTELAAYLIDPNRSGYELDDLASEYGLDPRPSPASEPDTEALVRHAAAVLGLPGPLNERLDALELTSLYREVELPLSVVLRSMEAVGVRIDAYRMGEITARLADRVEELEARAEELAEEPFLLGSTQQVARILFDRLQLAAGRKGKTGYSTDAKVLRGLRDAHPIVAVIEEWREYSKLLNTYLGPLPSLISPEDGRLHTTFNQAVASTGRLSTSNPNLQSIPIRTELGRTIRSAFLAEPGWKLVSADYSQVELRILAHVSGEPKLRDAFARGEDIHAATAAEVLGKDRSTLTKDERNRAKAVNFGIIYGISAFGLADQLDISRDEAQEYIDAYLARFPHVQDFIQRTVEQAERDGFVRTLLGRRRSIPELRASNRQTRSLGERLAVNTIMQGTAADIIKVPWWRSTVACARRAGPVGSSSRFMTSCFSRRPRRKRPPCAISYAPR